MCVRTPYMSVLCYCCRDLVKLNDLHNKNARNNAKRNENKRMKILNYSLLQLDIVCII